MTKSDPVVEEPLTGEPIRQSILDAANDPVAAAERALEVALEHLYLAAVDFGGGGSYERASRAREAATKAARRYAAQRALAERADACAVYDLNGFGPCDPGCRHTDCGNVRRGLGARREALEKEAADATG